ncbi:MAG: isoprenylcysteine carboxylmethyltransferase family protein, partial [Proteobacteria bacterium]|nr:isoprenylcysteine carboxylmethyltransferase family protein [Pseudomonadota bacterium]
GVLFFFSFVGLFIFLSTQLDNRVGFTRFPPSPWNIGVSVPVLFLGAFLIICSNYYFIRSKGTPVPFNPPPKVVMTGPYAYARNPMLTGVFLVLFGVGVLLQSVSLVFIFTPLFILINLIELKSIEEPEFEKRLGEKYARYKKQTPMFFPRPCEKTTKSQR